MYHRLLSALFLVLAASSANATLIGDTVNCSENFVPVTCSPSSAVVGAGVESFLQPCDIARSFELTH